MKIIIFGVLFFIQLLSWVIVRLMCEFKYYWCKRDCAKCGN